MLTKAAVFLEYIRYLAYAGMLGPSCFLDTMLTECGAVFSLMRGYALTRRWLIATIIFTLSLAPLSVNMVCDSGAVRLMTSTECYGRSQAQYALGVIGIPDPVVGCTQEVLATPTEAIMSAILAS